MIVAGIHAVKHALRAGEVQELIVEKGRQHPRLNELIHLAKQARLRVSFAPKKAMDRLSEGAPHQGVVARTGARALPDFDAWLRDLDMQAAPMVLLLDQVTDPHNLGACIRTAEAARCAGVVIPKDHAADLHSPVVAKAACGALSRLPVLRVTNLARALEALQSKGFWTIGLAGEADKSLYDVAFDGAMAVVLGSEGKGLRRLVREACDELVRIPMLGEVESLNVSVAAGIALFEIRRQRSEGARRLPAPASPADRRG